MLFGGECATCAAAMFVVSVYFVILMALCANLKFMTAVGLAVIFR